ncbi:hypothetical protein [Gloeocapsa sp. PCC 73106]|uniref:hypothetical protein n=1 Tax=Gloeocapsa sp. PCC 73106 TaxID=102232 RepID=UPI0002AC805D|nr:hypothetical protein [Gloeocapsa sp. PCC 73106]ELR99456.1 hypothetical protein GLO73106DRAFT_00033070 [Gloeocapsa sp. PCC 73106]
MTAVTLPALRKCDLAIMVVSATSPFGMFEADFFINNILANGILRVFFLVNLIDLLKCEKDIERVIYHVKIPE